jgi:hypothetical protein
VGLVVSIAVAACAIQGSIAPPPLPSADASPSTEASAAPSTEASPAPSAAASIALPATDWENADSNPALRASHDEACRRSDVLSPGVWEGLVRVVEQQRSGWPFHLYWDGGTLHVACFAPPYALAAVEVSVLDWADRDLPGRRPEPAALESVTLLPDDERRMGWGTVDPRAAKLRLVPADGPAIEATIANGYFVAQWPPGSDRRQPRLEAVDSCGEPLVVGDTRTPCPAD